MMRIWFLLCLLLTLVVGCEQGAAVSPAVEPAPKESLLSGAWAVRGMVYDVARGEGEGIAGSSIVFQINRGEKLVAEGKGAISPDGSFTIGVYIEEGDTVSLQAKAPGYLSSSVHLTLEEIAAGNLVRIDLELPTNVALSIVGYEWKPAQLEPGISELPEAESGGLLTIYVRNGSPLPLGIDALTVDGLDVGEHVAQHRVRWSRMRPDPLSAGGMGAWELSLADARADVQLGLYPSGALPLNASLVLRPTPIAVSYATWDQAGDRLLVFVHNRDERALFEIEDVLLNGEQAEVRIAQRELGPGETGLIIISPGFGRELLDTVYCQVRGRIIEGSSVSAWAAIRSLAPVFPIGTWPDANELDESVLADLKEHGIDTLVLDLPQSPDDPVWKQVVDDSDLGVIGVPRFPASRVQLSVFRDQPGLLAWFISDEPELNLNRDLYGALDQPHDSGDDSDASWRLAPGFAEAERSYRQGSGPPTYVNYWSYRLLPKYAPIPDIAGMAHFAVDAPGANWRGSHSLQEVFTYTLGLRYHAAPAPIWPWVQALCSTSWYENTGACWNRLPTLSELRAQLYLQLNAGAKGVLWFTHRLPFVEEGAAQWAEVGRQSRLIGALREFFLYGDIADTVRISGGNALARAVVSEDAVVIPLVNLDYDWQKRVWAEGQDPPMPSEPYAFHPREDLVLSVLMPEWIRPETAFLVTPEGVSEVPWESAARVVTLTLPVLDDVALLIVSDQESLAEEVGARLGPCQLK